jgi:hypothetical protein
MKLKKKKLFLRHHIMKNLQATITKKICLMMFMEVIVICRESNIRPHSTLRKRNSEFVKLV